MLPFFMRKAVQKYKPEKHEKHPKKGKWQLGVCLLRHNFMDTHQIKELVAVNKRMSSDNPYAYRYYLSL